MAIHLSSTLTEESKNIEMELISWEGHTLNKIVDRCILLATSFMEGAGEFPYPYQIEPMKRIFRSVLTNDGANITALFARQMGKCLQKSTKVIRYDGTVDVVENIKEGDLLMGDDSTPRRVIGITKGIDELYKIVPKSPRAKPYVVNSNHTLSLIHNHRQKGKIKVDLPIAEVISGKYKSALKSSHLMGYQVPVTYQKLYAPLPIAPYTLGVWLGDGTSVCPSVTTMDKEIAELWYEEAKNRGLKVRETIKSGCSKVKTYHIIGALSGRRVTNSFLDDLNTLNLINNKHIPDIYRLGSEQTRLEVLAGLIDTDGHKPKDPNAKYTCELTLKEGQLIEDVISLVRSLGFRAGVKTKIVKGKKYTRCYIYGDMWRIPTRVPHKKYEYSTPLKEEPLHYGFDIEPIGEGEYYGFSLDGNHRFLLEDFTVTHNSSFTAATISTLLIIAPLLSRQFPDKFPYFKKGIMIGVFAPTAEQVSTTHARVEMMLSHDTSNAILNDPDIRGKKKYDSGLIQILGNPHKVNGVVESDWKSFVRFQTAAKQAKIESKSYQIVFGDECVTSDTKCHVARGNKIKVIKIKNVRVGDMVLSYDEEMRKNVFSKVLNKWNKGKRNVYRITLTNNKKITCTGNHKILTDKGWEYTENIVNNFDNYKLMCYDSNNNIRLGGLNGLLVRLIPSIIRECFRGWFYHKSKRWGKLSNKDRKLCKIKRVCIPKISLLKKYSKYTPKTNNKCRVGRRQHSVLYKVCSRHNGLGFGILKRWEALERYQRYYTKVTSAGIIHMVCRRWVLLSKRTRYKFINPFFYNRKSKNYDRGFKREIWYRLNIKSRLKRKRGLSAYTRTLKRYFNGNNKTFFCRLCGIQILRKTKNLLCCLWERISLCTPHNKESKILFGGLQETSRLQYEAYPRVSGKSKGKGESLLCEEESRENVFTAIKNVKKLWKYYVYDIETEHTHNFFANGLLVHNCQEVDDNKLTKSIRPMLAAYNGTSVYTGTPSPYICEFYNAILKNRAEDISKPDYLRNHYEYDYIVGGRYNVRYKKFVEGEKERLGEDSDSFQMSYMLRWLTEKGMALSPSDFQKYMSDGRADVEYAPINGFTYVAGLDLGKGINDPSVLTIARLEKNGTSDETIKKVVHWKEYSDRSWETQFEDILITLRAFSISSLAVDATGKGDPIVDRLKATLAHESITIYGIVFSTQSKHNMATDFYEEMFKHRIRIPSGKKTKNTKEFKKFYGEWLTAVKTFTGKYLQLEHPRDKANSHDDYVDSLLLMIYAAKKTTACVVKREFVDWRTPSTNKSQTYASATEYARVRVNELFNNGK